MKKQNEHDDPSLETAVFLLKSSHNGGFIFEPPKTKEPITRAQGLTGYRLCVYASGSLITDVFNSLTLISVSCLHFGQNSGKFSSTVSGRTLIRVLLLQIGHSTHFSFFNEPPPYHRDKMSSSAFVDHKAKQRPCHYKAVACLFRTALHLSICLLAKDFIGVVN